jgi:hypothetical protein
LTTGPGCVPRSRWTASGRGNDLRGRHTERPIRVEAEGDTWIGKEPIQRPPPDQTMSRGVKMLC